MITLFHAPRTRSSRFIWLLEELEAPYEIKNVNVRRGDGSGETDAGNPHPHGKVPAIRHDGVTIFESAAIALYLTDAFPHKEIGPKIGDKTRGPYLTWLAYYAGVMEPAWVSKFMKFEAPRSTAGWVPAEETLVYIEKSLQSGPYLLGGKFSAADVLYASTFKLFMGGTLLPKTEWLERYVNLCTERPACKRADAKDAAAA